MVCQLKKNYRQYFILFYTHRVPEVRINSQVIEEVKYFKHLVYIMKKNGRLDMEIGTRIQNACKMFNLLKNVLLGRWKHLKKLKQ